MLDNIAREAFRRIGRELELPYLPAERSLIAANDGLHDGELNRIAGMEQTYPNLMRVDESMMVFEFVGFTKDAALMGGQWENLRSYRIGLIKGWKILEANVGHFPHVTYFHSAEALFKGMDSGRVDVALYGKKIGYAIIADLGLKKIRAVEPPFAKREMFMYLHKKHRELLAPLAAALRTMKIDGSYNAIVRQALSPYEQMMHRGEE
jgi:polar amino acid transport system substrate-binding protein